MAVKPLGRLALAYAIAVVSCAAVLHALLWLVPEGNLLVLALASMGAVAAVFWLAHHHAHRRYRN